MENVVVRDTETASKNAQLEEECRPYSWLKDYLERLEGQEAREEYYSLYEHCALMGSLLA